MRINRRLGVLALTAAAVIGPVSATALAAPASAAPVSAACCSGGGRSSSSVSNHSSTGQVSTGRSTTVRSGSGSGSSTNTRTSVHGGGTSNSAALKPINSGSLVTRGRATVVSTRPVVVSRSTRVSGSSYTIAGATYTYESPSYWRGTLRPRYGTPAYWTVYNDPYYYPNYLMPGNPWYGHAYPVGYVVSNGYFAPASSGPGVLAIILICVGLVAVCLLAYWRFVLRPRRSSRMPGRFGSSY